MSEIDKKLIFLEKYLYKTIFKNILNADKSLVLQNDRSMFTLFNLLAEKCHVLLFSSL